MIARFNVAATKLVGRRDLGIQIGIAIPFNNPRDDGMPSESERKQLDVIEELIKERIGKRGYLVGVITTRGMREFVAYTGATDWIRSFHESLAEAVSTHKMQIMAQEDPNWRVYRQFVP